MHNSRGYTEQNTNTCILEWVNKNKADDRQSVLKNIYCEIKHCDGNRHHNSAILRQVSC